MNRLLAPLALLFTLGTVASTVNQATPTSQTLEFERQWRSGNRQYRVLYSVIMRSDNSCDFVVERLSNSVPTDSNSVRDYGQVLDQLDSTGKSIHKGTWDEGRLGIYLNLSDYNGERLDETYFLARRNNTWRMVNYNRDLYGALAIDLRRKGDPAGGGNPASMGQFVGSWTTTLAIPGSTDRIDRTLILKQDGSATLRQDFFGSAPVGERPGAGEALGAIVRVLGPDRKSVSHVGRWQLRSTGEVYVSLELLDGKAYRVELTFRMEGVRLASAAVPREEYGNAFTLGRIAN